MDISVSYDNSTALVAINGDLDTTTSPEFETLIAPVFEQASTIIFDFTNVGYISSSGLRIMLVSQRKALANGGSLKLRNLNETVRDVFEISGFVTLLDIE